MADVALSSDQIGGLAIGVIVAVVVVGFVIGLLVNRAIARVLVAIVVIALGVLVWSQRTSLQNRVKNCDSNISFFGYHTTLSSSAQAHCAALKK
jgi:hypothetical protein